VRKIVDATGYEAFVHGLAEHIEKMDDADT
jgi:hypothetical protein